MKQAADRPPKYIFPDRTITIFNYRFEWMVRSPLVTGMRYEIDGNTPDIPDSCFVAPNASIIGEVSLATDCSVWPFASLRADSDTITVGAGTNIQDNTVLHTATGYPTTVGENVTIGHNAIVHACTVADECLIGMGAVVLTGAEIGEHCLIAAGAVIPEEKEIPAGSVVMGVPGKVVREVTEDDVERIRENARIYVEKAEKYRDGLREL